MTRKKLWYGPCAEDSSGLLLGSVPIFLGEHRDGLADHERKRHEQRHEDDGRSPRTAHECRSPASQSPESVVPRPYRMNTNASPTTTGDMANGRSMSPLTSQRTGIL